jgi:hypothetical protein
MSAFGGKADTKRRPTAPSANPDTACLCIEPPPPIANHRYAEYDTEARERGSNTAYLSMDG